MAGQVPILAEPVATVNTMQLNQILEQQQTYLAKLSVCVVHRSLLAAEHARMKKSPAYRDCYGSKLIDEVIQSLNHEIVTLTNSALPEVEQQLLAPYVPGVIMTMNAEVDHTVQQRTNSLQDLAIELALELVALEEAWVTCLMTDVINKVNAEAVKWNNILGEFGPNSLVAHHAL